MSVQHLKNLGISVCWRPLWKCQITKEITKESWNCRTNDWFKNPAGSQKKNWCLDHDFGREKPKWDRLVPLWNLTARVSIFSAAVSWRRNENSFSIWTDLKMNRRPSVEKQGARCRISAREKAGPTYVTCMASSENWEWDLCDQCWASPSPVISLSHSYWAKAGPSGPLLSSPSATDIWNRQDVSHHHRVFFSPVSVKGARRNHLRWPWKLLSEAVDSLKIWYLPAPKVNHI